MRSIISASWVLILALFFISRPACAQDGFDRMTDPRRNLNVQAPVCTPQPESSQESFVERKLRGMTIMEAAFGDEMECLGRNGLLSRGSLSPSNYTQDDDLNNFFAQCTFIRTGGEYRDIENITMSVHLSNRDRLINGLWQDIANRSERQIYCRIDTVDKYFNNDSSRQALNGRASEKFEEVVDKIRGLILAKKRSLQRNQREVFRRFDCSGLAWFFCRDVVNESTERDIEKHEAAIATEIAKIPFGYEPDVAEALYVMAEQGSFDPNRFSYALDMTRRRYNSLADYYKERKGDGSYCIDNEFKKKAVSSGVAQQLLSKYHSQHMSPAQKALVTCNIESKYKTTVENLDQAANVAFMVGGAATAVMTAIPSGGGSVAAFGAIASAGLSAASFAYQVKRSHEACFSREFVISAEGAETCNPDADFQKEINQPNLTECLTEIGIGALDAVFIPLDISAFVRANRAVHINSVTDDAIAASLVQSRRAENSSRAPGAARADGGADEVADGGEIVVTGFRTPRFFDRGDYRRLERSLSQKGVTLGEDVSPAVFRTLSSNEKVAVIEALGSSLSRTEGRNLRRFFERYPDGVLPEAQMNELRGILAEGLQASELARAQERLDELVEKGFIRPESIPALTARAEGEVRDSLRARGITEENYRNFFDRSNPIPLTDNERLFLFEQYSGLKLSSAEGRSLIDLHELGEGYGQYTLSELREKATGIRDLLVSRGITDPDQISEIINVSLRQGVLGKVPSPEDSPGLLATIRSWFGGGPRVAPIPDEARANWRTSREEVLDPARASPEVSSAAAARATDLFAPRFTGTADEMVRRNAFRDDALYQGNRELWWDEVTLLGTESKSPLAQVYGEAAGGANRVRRTVYWPRRQIEATATQLSRRDVALDSYRLVVNQAQDSSGAWRDKSLEMIVRNPDGTYSPMFYVKQGDEWVPSRTFKGEPIERACIGCHHRPPARDVFTPFPFAGARNPDGLAHGYRPFADRMVREGGGPLVDRTPRLATTGPDEVRALSTGDRFRVADEALPGRGLLGDESNIPRRRALTMAGRASADDSETILRYGMTRAELANYQSTNGGALPSEVFNAADTAELIRRGFTPPRPANVRTPSSAVSDRRTRPMLTSEEMRVAGSLEDAPRMARARELIGEVSPAQEAAILRAHNLGEEGIGNYPPRVLAEKARILEEADIPVEQRRVLFENGVVGGNRVDPTLSPSELRSEGISLNTQAQNNYRLAGRETDVARRSELLRAYQSDRRLAGQNFEQSAINDGEGAFSQAIGNRTNAALAYAAAGDVDSLVRVLDAGVLRGTAQRNLTRAREAVPRDPADPLYATLRVEADTWAQAVSRLESRRPAAASATSSPRPRPAAETPVPSSARRSEAPSTSTPEVEAPPITPEFIRSLSKEEALSRAQAAASSGRHDEAALLFRRASNSERLSDPNFLQAFNESLKGDASLAQSYFQRSQRNQTSTIAFITELKNYAMIETMLPRQKENLRAILESLSGNSLLVPRTGPYRGWIDDMIGRLPARPLPTGNLRPVASRGATSSAVSTNRTRTLLTTAERRVAGGRTDAERITEARSLVGTVSPAQEAAILRAHNLGSEYRIGTYPQRVLQQKARILEEAGFNRQQRRSLMENGIVGGNGPVGRVDPDKAALAPIARTDQPPELAPVDMAEVERFNNSRHYREVTLRRARENKEARDAGRAGRGEYTVHATDFESARDMVLDLPILQELGYGRPNIGEWRIFQSNLPRSALYGRMVGYQRRLPNGNLATVRLDWDETKGAHYNIEIEGPDGNLRTVNYDLAVTFRCGGVPCTEAQVYELQDRLIVP